MESGDETSARAERGRARREFFAAGVETWLPLLGELTFPSVSIPLPKATAACFAATAGQAFNDGGILAAQIDAHMTEQGWSQTFVKLSTRSPKDAPQILQRAATSFRAQGGLTLGHNERCVMFSGLIQENFVSSNGQEAAELLASSERIREDCQHALEADDDEGPGGYDALGVHVVLRRWDGAIPPANEFRGICWKGQQNALSQYYHQLFFPDLENHKDEIQKDIQSVYATIQPKLSESGLGSCLIDWAWLGPQKVRVIEVNPFDGIGLGTMHASTCLFKWDDPEDHRIITQGPFEFRHRTASLSAYDFKIRMNPEWRDIVFPPQWQLSSHRSSKGEGKSKSELPQIPSKGKGKGKGLEMDSS